MTIDKIKYQEVLTQVDASTTAVTLLGDAVDNADPENTFGVLFNNIFGNLASVAAWAELKILEAEQEQVMATFLAEMKVVFDKYSATISTMAFEDGYGASYGEPGTGFLLTANLDGVTSTKEIKKAVIVSGDLV